MISCVFSSIKQMLHFTAAILALGWAVAAGAANAAPLLADTFHTDGRGTPKLVFPPPGNGPAAKGRLEADHFLKVRQAEFKLPADPGNLELVSTRESLLGTHYRYRQLLNGLPVEGADLVVSIRRDTGQVYQAYNNTWPVAAPPALPKALIGDNWALDAAWNHLRVHGKLLTGLRSQLVYLPEKGGFRLIYKTLVATEAPFGYWEHQIDATAGDVVAVRDTVVHLSKQPEPVPDFGTYDGPLLSRAEAVQTWDTASAASKQIPGIQAAAASGTAKVFDPDPRTTLANDTTLLDTSSAATFTSAYFTRPLLDITLSAGVYSLVGPWVQIVNTEAPNTAPSTSTTGNWTALRGNNAFNDAMTYFHIDQNQRYLQSLGYTGATGIQYGSIQADSDGLSGDDNSHYLPATNRLAFGHGGVDDNEDADVILHEYGHAITYDIIASWGGGDTGAIGEGFGDYWGASYSSTTTNGATFHPAWAFTWDGHGADTWSGRFLDLTTLTYNPAHTYVAHETISGIANYSDQLWGTPLFQAFLTLRGMGYPRVDMDKIIIESFFGIGGNPTMRDMANATVNAAKLLFPAGPHASTFFSKFAAQNILTKNPTAFAAVVVGATQIDLSWVKSLANDNVMVAWNTTNTFGTPSGTYSVGNAIAGGGTVLYNGSGTSVSHTGRTAGTTYYYKAWSVLAGPAYTSGVTCSAVAGESLVFAEGFENGGSIPTGWTQTYDASLLNWIFRAGSTSSIPLSAHGGSHNACLYDETSANNITKLITPAINFETNIQNTKVTFWHYMQVWSNDQDQLKVYYRTSAGGTWTLLASYLSSVATWTQQTISLPNANSTYYLAFEGNAKFGYGVCIDDVRVVGVDTTPPTVTINQAVGQADPANGSPINFTVVFSEAVSDFATGDVTITGTAPGTKTATVTGSGTTYNVAVSGMMSEGTVIAALAAGVAHDAAGNANTTSTSTDNTVTYALTRLQSWRDQYFGRSDNAGNAADTADPNKNSIVNLLEYALDGDPADTTTGLSILPRTTISAAGHLRLSLTRTLDRTGITLTVQGSNDLAGSWTDLARSIGGAAFTALIGGVTVTESGTGATRSVTIDDLYSVTDPAHPCRFMRLRVTNL
jgi:hypothetical protein